MPEFLNSLFNAQPSKAPKITQVINNNCDNTWIGATDETAKTRYALWNCITEAIDHTARGTGANPPSSVKGKPSNTRPSTPYSPHKGPSYQIAWSSVG